MHLEKKFFNGLDDDGMVAEMVWELTSMVDSTSETSEQILTWARRVEAQIT